VTRDEWIDAFATAVGVSPPTSEEIDSILELAATAAHDSERTAAPVACWVAASAGKSLAEANAIATRIATG
jgi:hypothetical protein